MGLGPVDRDRGIWRRLEELDFSRCCSWFSTRPLLRDLVSSGVIDLYTDFVCCGEMFPVVLVPIDLLRPHEETEPERLSYLERDILGKRVLERPILVDMDTLVILDGHHRHAVLRRIGKKKIPALLIDYQSPCVSVSSWRPGERVSKEDVVRAGTGGRLMPPRTSRHILCFEIPYIHMPLDRIP